MNNSFKSLPLVLSLSLLLIGCSSNKKIDAEKNTSSTLPTNGKTYTDNSSNDTGIVIGLKHSNTENKKPANYKTLWISLKDNTVEVLTGDNFILVPYEDTFYKLENESFNIKSSNKLPTPNNKGKTSPLGSFGYKLDYYSIVSFPIDKKPAPLYSKDYVEKYIEDEGFPIQNTIEELLYAGAQYVMINRKYYFTDGGMISASGYSNRLYNIGKIEGSNPLDIKQFILGDLTSTLEEFRSKYNIAPEPPDENPLQSKRYFVDDKNILILRAEGKWNSYVPLTEEHINKGSGSINTKATKNLLLPQSVSTKLTIHDNLILPFEKIKERIPEAVDAVSSPNGKMLIVLTKNNLQIFINAKDILSTPIKIIELDKPYTLVLNQWATGKYVSSWTKQLHNYLKDNK